MNIIRAELLYRETRDGGDPQTLWDSCEGYEETITLVRTGHGSTIGVYCSSRIEDTSEFEDDLVDAGTKLTKG